MKEKRAKEGEERGGGEMGAGGGDGRWVGKGGEGEGKEFNSGSGNLFLVGTLQCRLT